MTKKELHALRQRQWVAANREKVNRRQREYAKLNKIQILKSNRKWKLANPERNKHHKAITMHRSSTELRPWYLAHFLNRHGMDVTPENIRQFKQRIQLWRCKLLFKTMATASEIAR